MRTQYLQCTLVALMLLLTARAYGLPGESIVLDPNTGNYTITYLGYNESGESEERTVLRVAMFEPATKIDPTVRSTLKMGANGIVEYRYRIHNGMASRQPLVMILFDPITTLIATDSLAQPELDMHPNAIAHNWGVASYPMIAPDGWNTLVTTSRLVGLRVSWSSTKSSLPIGTTRNGFGLFSNDLPGIGMAQLRGKSAIRKFVDEGPIGEVGDQLKKLVQNDYVPRNAALPTIAVPIPFDTAVLLDRIRTHVATWPGKQLLDPSFATQLDRYLAAAADAYRLNNAKAGKEHIQKIRELLEHEHKQLDHDDEDNEDTDEHKAATRFTIDRLAARVLDFDLRYVLKRAEHEHEEGERKKGRD